MGKLPDDACPFPRPFPEDFADCPLYDPVPFEGRNLFDDPLPSVRVCSHLVVGTFADSTEHRYGRCEFGDGAARLRWLGDKIKSASAASEVYFPEAEDAPAEARPLLADSP